MQYAAYPTSVPASCAFGPGLSDTEGGCNLIPVTLLGAGKASFHFLRYVVVQALNDEGLRILLIFGTKFYLSVVHNIVSKYRQNLTTYLSIGSDCSQNIIIPPYLILLAYHHSISDTDL